MLHKPLQLPKTISACFISLCKSKKKYNFSLFSTFSLQVYDQKRTGQSPWQNMVKPFCCIKILSNCVLNCELYNLLWSSIMPTTYLKVTCLAPRHLSSPIIYYFLTSNNAFLCQKIVFIAVAEAVVMIAFALSSF